MEKQELFDADIELARILPKNEPATRSLCDSRSSLQPRGSKSLELLKHLFAGPGAHPQSTRHTQILAEYEALWRNDKPYGHGITIALPIRPQGVSQTKASASLKRAFEANPGPSMPILSYQTSTVKMAIKNAAESTLKQAYQRDGKNNISLLKAYSKFLTPRTKRRAETSSVTIDGYGQRSSRKLSASSLH